MDDSSEAKFVSGRIRLLLGQIGGGGERLDVLIKDSLDVIMKLEALMSELLGAKPKANEELANLKRFRDEAGKLIRIKKNGEMALEAVDTILSSSRFNSSFEQLLTDGDTAGAHEMLLKVIEGLHGTDLPDHIKEARKKMLERLLGDATSRDTVVENARKLTQIKFYDEASNLVSSFVEEELGKFMAEKWSCESTLAIASPQITQTASRLVGLASGFIKEHTTGLAVITGLLKDFHNPEYQHFILSSAERVVTNSNKHIVEIIERFRDKTQVASLDKLFRGSSVTLAEVASVLSCSSGLLFLIGNYLTRNKSSLEEITQSFIDDYSFKRTNLSVVDTVRQLVTATKDGEEFYISAVLQELMRTLSSNPAEQELGNLTGDLFVVLKAQLIRTSYLGLDAFGEVVSKTNSAIVGTIGALISRMPRDNVLNLSHHLLVLSRSIKGFGEQIVNGSVLGGSGISSGDVGRSVLDFAEHFKVLSAQMVEQNAKSKYSNIKLKFEPPFTNLNSLSISIQNDYSTIVCVGDDVKKDYLYQVMRLISSSVNESIKACHLSIGPEHRATVETSLRNFITTFSQLTERPLSVLFDEGRKLL